MLWRKISASEILKKVEITTKQQIPTAVDGCLNITALVVSQMDCEMHLILHF